MKIIFVISSLHSGGAERVLSTLANVFSNKHSVVIIKLDDQEPFYPINNKIIIENLNLPKRKRTFLNKIRKNVDIIVSYRRYIKRHDPDVVISFMDITNIYVIIATRFLNSKIIISERINYTYLKNIFWRFARYLTYSYSDGMVVLSQFDYDKYKNVKNKKIIFNPLFVTHNFPVQIEKENIILSVGRLVDDKGFDILLKSLALIQKDLLKDWKVYIIGDGVKRDILEDISKKFMLTSTVEFLGRKKNISDYYRKASIFISTSRAEGFPNALSEALSFGCSVIATDCLTGPSELIENNKNGFLVDVDDVDTIKNKLEILMNDKNLRENFAKQSIKRSSKFTVDKIALEWEKYIYEIKKIK